MYDWLSERLQAGPVVTANQRLARELSDTWNAAQAAVGKGAWRTPEIFPWPVWLHRLAESVVSDRKMPLRLGPVQSQVVWEQCLEREIHDPLLSLGSLSRLAREAWLRVHEWQVPFDEVAESARSADQRLFVRAARRYRERLAAAGWIDDAMLPSMLERLLRNGTVSAPDAITFAGFDRVSPRTRSLCRALEKSGAQVEFVSTGVESSASLQCFDDIDAELRAAGAWAREALLENPALRIGIVVNRLEQDADRCTRLIREGLAPGRLDAGDVPVDTSYGAALSGYPAIVDALLVLRWLFNDIDGADVGRLLRSPFIGRQARAGRLRLELRLRELPDRGWSVPRLVGALRPRQADPEAQQWFDRITAVAARAGDLRGRQMPADWGEFFSASLAELGWPGEAGLSSRDYQLIDRWRSLLEEFSRLQLVAGGLSGAAAVSRLASMAADTLYQPRKETSVVAVLGPLEAAGMQFDRLWAAGFGADQWPPAGRPLPLLARDLQQRHQMPDATPEDTAEYAATILERLGSSASRCVFSYPATIGDAGQLPSALLSGIEAAPPHADPGWYAASLVASAELVPAKDPVPAAVADDPIIGGAGTVNRQRDEPFSAFACGRLGVRWLEEFKPGIAANVRGNLVHDALRNLYADHPSSTAIRSWTAQQLADRISAAVDAAFGRHSRFADEQLGTLLGLERQRTIELMHAVVNLDRERGDFDVVSVEESIETAIGGITLSLRSDRIDRLADKSCVIFDYKTGSTKSFLKSGEPADMQLVVYASVADDIVSGIGLYNVDKQAVVISGAGPAITGQQDWDEELGAWMHEVTDACKAIARGDVRINRRQSLADARPLALLSRFAEIRHDD